MRFFVSILSFHEYGAFRPNSTCAFYCNSPRLLTESQNQYEKPHRAHAPRTSSLHLAPRSQQNFKKRAARICERPAFGLRSAQNAPVPNFTRPHCSMDLNLGTVPKLRLERYDSSLRPSSSMASMSASAAAESSPLAKMYSLILGSVPEGRTMALFPPSRSNSMTSALGRPFTHVA